MAEEEQKQVARREERPLAKAGFSFLPQSWEQLYNYAKEISLTDFVPKAMQGKPGAVLAAWQKGQEVGLPPMASLESIAIINGRPAIHSNGYWSLITGHPLCEWFTELPPDEALQKGYGECTIKRRGNPHPIVRRFSMAEAKTAKLTEKDNWKNYPGDMLQNRARHRAGDDAIPEAAQGLLPADVARDLEPRDVTEAQPYTKPQAIDDGGASESDSKETLADKPVETVTQKTAGNGKKSSGNTKESALEWVEKAPDAEIVDNNGLNAHIKGLSQSEQLEVCKSYNARRQAIIGELEKGNAEAGA
jgi:hypothetical protein